MIRQSLAIHLGLSIVIAVCTGVPASVAAVIQSLWSSLVSDLGTLAMLQLVVGALPTAFYVLLPAACVIAICWLYWAGSDSNAIPAMYAAGISVYTCARPAILTVALLATVSAVDAWVVAPRGVGMVEDVKYQLHHTVNIGSLAEGQFHSLNFEGGNATISFRKSLGDNRFEGFFFASVNSRTKKRFAISARRAVITRDRSKMTIIFESGTRIDLKSRSQSAIVAFRSYKLSLPSYSESNSINRTKVTIPEMNLEQLLALSRDKKARRKLVGVAKSEVAKRFLMPVMVLSHSLLAIGLLYSFGPIRMRLSRIPLSVAAGLTVLHVTATILIELVARISFWVTALMAAVIVIEAMIGVGLLLRSGRTVRPFRWPWLHARSYVTERPHAADVPSRT